SCNDLPTLRAIEFLLGSQREVHTPEALAETSNSVARKILTHRHQLLASPAYFAACKKQPKKPQDLLDHRLLAFSFWKPVNAWSFVHVNGKKKETLTFHRHLSMKTYTGGAAGGHRHWRSSASRATGISKSRKADRGDAQEAFQHLPSVGRNHYMNRPVRVFKEFA